jgi:hypothetical protein
VTLVRFDFYAHGHTKPFTGYVALRSTEGEKWVLSSRSLTKRELTTLEGEGMHKGGKTFLEEMHHFLAYWATAQAEAIERHRKWSSAKEPTRKLVRPGFRAVTAAKQWHDYKRDTETEISMIEKDAVAAYAALHEGGWIPEPETTPFPKFMFGDPWESPAESQT